MPFHNYFSYCSLYITKGLNLCGKKQTSSFKIICPAICSLVYCNLPFTLYFNSHIHRFLSRVCLMLANSNNTTIYFNFTISVSQRISIFFVIKPTRYTNFTNLFWHETVHVSDSSSVHHREFIHCTLSNGICHTDL